MHLNPYNISFISLAGVIFNSDARCCGLFNQATHHLYIFVDKKFIEYVLESDETQDGRECDELQGP